MKNLPSLKREARSSPLWDLHRKIEGDEVEYSIQQNESIEQHKEMK
jgi:hypothetical protein